MTATRPAPRFGGLLLAAALGAVPAQALPSADIATASAPDDQTVRLPEAAIVERSRQVRIQGRQINYVARAGRLPIVDDQTGGVQAWIFFTAYTAERKAGDPPRPLTFIWNGGPGSSSSLVHLGGFGPRRIVTPDNPPYGGNGNDQVEIVDNEESWLADSDLVFVDPVGTGYSRAVSPEAERAFLNTPGDAESVAEFIRVYRDRYRAWDQPLIQGGESYGVTRAAWVAERLLARGIRVDGVLLITWDIPLGSLPPAERHALALPTYTAAAFYHRRLAPELQANFEKTMAEAKQWSQTEYLDAIRRRDTLGKAERADVVAKLARYVGLRPDQIDAKTLEIVTRRYAQTLLADKQLVIGRYDSRYVASTVGAPPDKLPDPMMNEPDAGLVERYFRDELGYATPIRYAGAYGAYSVTLEADKREVGGRWHGESSAEDDAPRLMAAVRMNPRLKILDMCGYYDLGANCTGDDYLIRNGGPDVASNAVLRSYEGGHAPYLAPAVRPLMRRDFGAFARSVVNAWKEKP